MSASLLPTRRRTGGASLAPPVLAPFWAGCGLLAVLVAGKVPLDGTVLTVVACLAVLTVGMVHGAFDLHVLQQSHNAGRHALRWQLSQYLLLAGASLLLWHVSPAIGLILFLGLAATHFAEDWTLLDEPFLRVALGLSTTAAAALGQPHAVDALFAGLSDTVSAQWLTRTLQAAAPVILLVSAVGLLIAWQKSAARELAAAHLAALVGLLLLPPLVGFALYFVLLHAALNLSETRRVLAAMTAARFAAEGAGMVALTLCGGLLAIGMASEPFAVALPLFMFKLVAAVLLPHMVCAHSGLKWARRPKRAARA